MAVREQQCYRNTGHDPPNTKEARSTVGLRKLRVLPRRALEASKSQQLSAPRASYGFYGLTLHYGLDALIGLGEPFSSGREEGGHQG
jgi:hypothetical protein